MFHDCQVSSGPFQVTQPPDSVSDPMALNSVEWTPEKRRLFVLSLCWILNWPRPPASLLRLGFPFI